MSKLPTTRKEAVRELYRRGHLAWKLHQGQREIYDLYKQSGSLKFVLNCSRRYGKSYLLCLIAIETAFATPNVQVRYAAPTQKMVKNIIQPIFRKILEDCPADLKPRWNSQEGCYKLKNGSQIHVAGTNRGYAENLRGTETHLGIADEAGFVECDGGLNYLVQDILMPQTLTCNGRLILASTPPKTPGHDFVSYCYQAELEGAYAKRTIYQNPEITPEKVEQYAKEAGGKKSSTFRREYLCEFITDEDSAVIPEFTDEKALELVKEVPRPEYFDSYVGMDVGFKDLTFLVFGYWDFANSQVVIEEELVLKKMLTEPLANGVREIERRLWGRKEPFLRVSDIDLRLIEELRELHSIRFTPTPKDNKEAALNRLRMLVTDNQIVIHPRCKQLIAHLKYATWNKSHSTFERTEEHGHFDGVDALVYLIRNIKRHKNPFPEHHGVDPYSQYVDSSPNRNPSARAVLKLFKPKLVS